MTRQNVYLNEKVERNFKVDFRSSLGGKKNIRDLRLKISGSVCLELFLEIEESENQRRKF